MFPRIAIMRENTLAKGGSPCAARAGNVWPGRRSTWYLFEIHVLQSLELAHRETGRTHHARIAGHHGLSRQ